MKTALFPAYGLDSTPIFFKASRIQSLIFWSWCFYRVSENAAREMVASALTTAYLYSAKL
ncbi:MAG: hypothetical protein ACREDR_42390 [Blastocatellia bacterium]